MRILNKLKTNSWNSTLSLLESRGFEVSQEIENPEIIFMDGFPRDILAREKTEVPIVYFCSRPHGWNIIPNRDLCDLLILSNMELANPRRVPRVHWPGPTIQLYPMSDLTVNDRNQDTWPESPQVVKYTEVNKSDLGLVILDQTATWDQVVALGCTGWAVLAARSVDFNEIFAEFPELLYSVKPEEEKIEIIFSILKEKEAREKLLHGFWAKCWALRNRAISQIDLLEQCLKQIVCKKEKKLFGFISNLHYGDHMVPVLQCLPTERRGYLGVDENIFPFALERFDIPVIPVNHGMSLKQEPLYGQMAALLVASHRDMEPVKTLPVPIILMEHGSGQSYNGSKEFLGNPAYAGGASREGLYLYVAPGETPLRSHSKETPKVPAALIGCPRLDPWIHTKAVRQKNIKPIVVIAFHWTQTMPQELRSAAPWFSSAFQALEKCEEFQIIGHHHPFSDDPFQHTNIPVACDFEEILAEADLICADNSSILFEGAAIGKPVVLLNAPWFRKNIFHGLRFWSEADVGLHCNDPRYLIDTIKLALEDPIEVRLAREAAVRRVYHALGRSVQLTRRVLLEALDSVPEEQTEIPPDSPYEVLRTFSSPEGMVMRGSRVTLEPARATALMNQKLIKQIPLPKPGKQFEYIDCEPLPINSLQCPYCVRRVFRNQSELIKHLRITHTGGIPCQIK